eukprot:1010649-Pelagomonas_calceolata.AAC.2
MQGANKDCQRPDMMAGRPQLNYGACSLGRGLITGKHLDKRCGITAENCMDNTVVLKIFAQTSNQLLTWFWLWRCSSGQCSQVVLHFTIGSMIKMVDHLVDQFKLLGMDTQTIRSTEPQAKYDISKYNKARYNRAKLCTMHQVQQSAEPRARGHEQRRHSAKWSCILQ